MAQFKEVTLTDGEKITINMDEIRTMQRFPDATTTIFFAKDHAIQVEETPDDIVSNTIRNA
jgi:uncharacterized protein YlzI (FlbEa/FlbD family)